MQIFSILEILHIMQYVVHYTYEYKLDISYNYSKGEMFFSHLI